ncbi:MAG: hypothetical protein WCS37_03775 [Chloroflexota bacterium]|nr:hypothetical protein [Chloroflexota bacterium]
MDQPIVPASIEIFIGLQARTIQGERDDLGGFRMFTAAYPPGRSVDGRCPPLSSKYLLDSGAFTDNIEKRLTPEQALERQQAWQRLVSYGPDGAGRIFNAFGLCSYDLLIDETWVFGKKEKRRWTIEAAEWAVRETVLSANYLALQRERLPGQKLILTGQGVDALQYSECACEILKVAQPQDWFGFGGWCIVGRYRSLLPEFFKTLALVLPMVKRAGLAHCHLFGVTYLPALGGLLYMADLFGLTVSTDGTKPIKDCLWLSTFNRQKAGCKVASGYWRDNVRWWQDACFNLRSSPYYMMPPSVGKEGF